MTVVLCSLQTHGLHFNAERPTVIIGVNSELEMLMNAIKKDANNVRSKLKGMPHVVKKFIEILIHNYIL